MGFVSHQQLGVYKRAFKAAMQIYQLSKGFPKEETYSLTDQVRRSSRSVCANIAEAWRKRRYESAFISKLSDAETEAAETQTWLEFAVHCQYLDTGIGESLRNEYNEVIAIIVHTIANADKWVLPTGKHNLRKRVFYRSKAEYEP